MKINCEKCGHITEIKNPVSVKGGNAAGRLMTGSKKTKMREGTQRYWEARRGNHNKKENVT